MHLGSSPHISSGNSLDMKIPTGQGNEVGMTEEFPTNPPTAKGKKMDLIHIGIHKNVQIPSSGCQIIGGRYKIQC